MIDGIRGVDTITIILFLMFIFLASLIPCWALVSIISIGKSCKKIADQLERLCVIAGRGNKITGRGSEDT
jgi:hypothetical protein